MVKVIIVDDHPAVRKGTETILKDAEMDVVSIENVDEVIKAAYDLTIDIFLLDLYMPEINGLELSKRILQINPEAKIAIYTGFDISPHFNLLVDAGVSGFISKMASPRHLVTSIKCILDEEVILPLSLLRQLRRDIVSTNIDTKSEETSILTLSKKEQKIMELISKGFTNKKIAEELYLSQRTIEYHLTRIFSKLKVNSRIEALQTARQYGLISKEKISNT